MCLTAIRYSQKAYVPFSHSLTVYNYIPIFQYNYDNFCLPCKYWIRQLKQPPLFFHSASRQAETEDDLKNRSQKIWMPPSTSLLGETPDPAACIGRSRASFLQYPCDSLSLHLLKEIHPVFFFNCIAHNPGQNHHSGVISQGITRLWSSSTNFFGTWNYL